jgi:hypothetical protein
MTENSGDPARQELPGFVEELRRGKRRGKILPLKKDAVWVEFIRRSFGGLGDNSKNKSGFAFVYARAKR